MKLKKEKNGLNETAWETAYTEVRRLSVALWIVIYDNLEDEMKPEFNNNFNLRSVSKYISFLRLPNVNQNYLKLMAKELPGRFCDLI